MRIVGALLMVMLIATCGRGNADRNGLCGVEGLEGEPIRAVEGPGACGIPQAVAVTRVAGVALSQPTRMTCEKAEALDLWVRSGAKPILSSKGGGLDSLRVAAGYACRSRNSREGARLSEHARGHAIDISAFVLKDGSSLTVQNDWSGQNGQTMQRLHKSACGIYGTVLGPRSDVHHHDHFHFDIADHRNGAYCR